jgi:DNA-binding MarR family transcriptional regulator
VSPSPPPDARGGVAFLLAQLGAYAGQEFAAALAEQDLTPPLVGILRVLRFEPGLSQQELAAKLGMVPSRVVAYVDDLQARGWVTRTRDADDRRVNVLTVTKAGEAAFAAVAVTAHNHEAKITAGLTKTERATLLELLGKLVALRGLTPGVHPGFRTLQ